jgi:peptide deformylase
MKLAKADKVECCKCSEVEKNEFPKTLRDYFKMSAIMSVKGGIGLAAPQVGIFKRFFIMKDFSTDGTQMVINPIITEFSDKIGSFREGCLTYNNLSVIVKRHKSIKATWTTITGEEIHRKLTGRESQVFQHEYDHLDGITITMK